MADKQRKSSSHMSEEISIEDRIKKIIMTQLTVKEEQKERKRIGEMFFDGADPLFEEA